MINLSRQMEVGRSRALGSSFSGCENCKIECVCGRELGVKESIFHWQVIVSQMGAGSDPCWGDLFSLHFVVVIHRKVFCCSRFRFHDLCMPFMLEQT